MSAPTPRLQSQATRERIIDAAALCFAEKGFQGVTVRDLAAGLGVHYSLINYHFRSKLELYREVVQRACASPRYAEISMHAKRQVDPHAQLVQAITHLLSESLSRRTKNGWQCCVVAQECLRGSDMLPKVIAPAIRPQFEWIARLIAQLRGERTVSLEAQFAAFGLFAQVDALVTYRPLLAALVPKMRGRTQNLRWCAEQLAEAAAARPVRHNRGSRRKGRSV